MIKSFADESTRRVFSRERVPAFGPDPQRAALKKLAILHAAGSLGDLRIPPGNRLEKLAGSREGQYSIRISDQWRICFAWRGGSATDVEIADYHRGR
jgi:toxin HigB-1